MKDRMEKLDEVPQDSLTLKAQVDELITYRKEQLKTLQHEVISEQALLAKTKQEIHDAQAQAKHQQQIERQQFVEQLQSEKDALRDERKSLETLDLELESRRRDVEVLEAKAIPIAEAMKKLSEERLAVEHQRLRNEELRQENDALASQTGSLHEEVSQLKASLLAQQTKLNSQASDQEQREISLTQLQKDVALQVENLNALKSTVDPKLKEAQQLREQAEADLHQVEVIRDGNLTQQAELDKQRADLSILSSQLQARDGSLREQEFRLKQFEAELRIKAQQAEAAGLKITPLPVEKPEPAPV